MWTTCSISTLSNTPTPDTRKPCSAGPFLQTKSLFTPKTNSAIEVFAYHCRQVFDHATFTHEDISAVLAVKDAVAGKQRHRRGAHYQILKHPRPTGSSHDFSEVKGKRFASVFQIISRLVAKEPVSHDQRIKPWLMNPALRFFDSHTAARDLLSMLPHQSHPVLVGLYVSG